jgi:general transcription factor 3C protein 4
VIQSSPLKVLMPHLLRIIAAPDQAGICSEINDFLSSDPIEEAVPPLSKGTNDPAALVRERLWGNRALDAMRLRYGLARWSAVSEIIAS